jgi:tRNA A-37 threonylcarbamoyl transferase component Bud32
MSSIDGSLKLLLDVLLCQQQNQEQHFLDAIAQLSKDGSSSALANLQKEQVVQLVKEEFKLDSGGQFFQEQMDSIKLRLEQLLGSMPSLNPAMGMGNGIKQICFYELRFKEKIGEGACGEVHLAEWSTRGIEVAVKKMKSDKRSVATNKAFLEEAKLMSALKHENLLVCQGICYEPEIGTLCVVTDYAHGGSLYHYLYENESSVNVELSACQRLRWMKQIGLGLGYLHAENIIHRDLKSLNILINKHGQLVVCDFGFAVARKNIIVSSGNMMTC